MRRTLATLCLLAVAGVWAGCGADNANTGNAGNGNATRNGVVETNANIRPNASGNTVPSNTAVVTNNNGNENTAGVKTTNSSNTHSGNSNKH
jgi:hypothetical protein